MKSRHLIIVAIATKNSATLILRISYSYYSGPVQHRAGAAWLMLMRRSFDTTHTHTSKTDAMFIRDATMGHLLGVDENVIDPCLERNKAERRRAWFRISLK